MPEFLPFVGTRYSKSRVNIENVVSPPYDIISSEYRDILYDRDPHNAVRLEFNRDNNPYTSSASFFANWKRDGILIHEERPAFYVYHQVFEKPDGGETTRTGVIGRLKLSDYSANEVIPHERTHAAPKRDRLELMEHTHANFSPIFGLVSDPSFLFDQTIEVATVHSPLADIEERLPNGQSVRHIIWRMNDEMAEARLSKMVGAVPVIIADGHHRYETALEFHQLHPEIRGSEYIMIFLSNLQSEGTVILPTHRLLHGVSEFNQFRLLERLKEGFDLIPFSNREEGKAELERDDASLTLVEFPEAPKYVVVRDRETLEREHLKFAATRLEEEILIPLVGLSRAAIDERRNMLYPHTFQELDEMEESQSWNAAFLLRAVRPGEVESVVKQGGFMPQKTTYFYPKLITGMVFHEFAAQQK
jgi:uncharacterized protein (DUF1015 family)